MAGRGEQENIADDLQWAGLVTVAHIFQRQVGLDRIEQLDGGVGRIVVELVECGGILDHAGTVHTRFQLKPAYGSHPGGESYQQ